MALAGLIGSSRPRDTGQPVEGGFPTWCAAGSKLVEAALEEDFDTGPPPVEPTAGTTSAWLAGAEECITGHPPVAAAVPPSPSDVGESRIDVRYDDDHVCPHTHHRTGEYPGGDRLREQT